MPMHGVALDSLEKAAELLALAFYVLALMALVMTLAGSIGSGFVLLILAASAHVGRASLEEFVDEQRAGGHRPKSELRAKDERVTERTRSTRRAAA
jgi:uncharacterized membrane protein